MCYKFPAHLKNHKADARVLPLPLSLSLKDTHTNAHTENSHVIQGF